MKKIILAVVTAMTLVGTSYAAGSGGGKGSHQRMQNFIYDHVLQLTDEQRAAVDAIDEAAKVSLDSIKELGVSKADFDVLDMESEDFDMQLAALAEQKGDMVEQMTVVKGQSRAQVYLLLTEEQKLALAEFKAEAVARKLQREQQREEQENTEI